MISMTGYGYSECQDRRFHITVELKSVNNRYLDVVVNLPLYLGPLEQQIRSFLTQRIGRGRIDVSVRIREMEENLSVFLDKKAVQAYKAVLEELRQTAEIEEPITIEHFLKAEGVVKIERNRDPEEYWERIRDRLQEAFEELDRSRRAEGRRTEEDILRYLGMIGEGRKIVAAHAATIEEKIRSDLFERFTQLLGDEVDPTRIYAETAVQLARLSVSEELERMKGHLESFAGIVAGDGAKGKKLDFLCQELNREINTIGSKSVLLPVNQAVIEMKDALENIREQLRNVE